MCKYKFILIIHQGGGPIKIDFLASIWSQSAWENIGNDHRASCFSFMLITVHQPTRSPYIQLLQSLTAGYLSLCGVKIVLGRVRLKERRRRMGRKDMHCSQWKYQATLGLYTPQYIYRIYDGPIEQLDNNWSWFCSTRYLSSCSF